jgi:signal transduction histidine kinase
MERIHPDDRGRVAQFRAALADVGHDTELEFRIVHPDGNVRYIYAIAHPVVDKAGRLVEVVGSSIDVTERKRAAAKLARAQRVAREARFAAAFEERTRLAREIHDSLLQSVTGIALQLRATLPHLKGAPASATDSIRGVVELAESTIRDARRAVWDMRAPSLVEKGLARALEETVRRAAGTLAFDFAIKGLVRPLPPEVEDTILRIAQESTGNVVKHAAAKCIRLRLTYTPRSARLTVTDDGRGFSVEELSGAYAGRWGLMGMRERADRIGASFMIRSAPRRGTTVALNVPLPRAKLG